VRRRSPPPRPQEASTTPPQPELWYLEPYWVPPGPDALLRAADNAVRLLKESDACTADHMTRKAEDKFWRALDYIERAMPYVPTIRNAARRCEIERAFEPLLQYRGTTSWPPA
jgi:hypothetical protein